MPYKNKNKQREYQKEYRKMWAEKNKDKISVKGKEYYQSNKTKISMKHKEYHQKNKEKIALKHKEYNQKTKEKMKQYFKEYKLKNKERLREYNRIQTSKYRKKNPEKIKDYKKEYYKKPNVREKIRNHDRKRRQTDINYKLKYNLRKRVHNALKKNLKSKGTMELIGCSIPELKQHLEKQFTFGMNWKNYGFGWHVDHRLPCTSFNLSKPEEQLKCFPT